MPSALMAESALLSKLKSKSKELGKKLEIDKKLFDCIFSIVSRAAPGAEPTAWERLPGGSAYPTVQIKCKIAPTSHSGGRSNFDLVRVEPVPSSCVAI